MSSLPTSQARWPVRAPGVSWVTCACRALVLGLALAAPGLAQTPPPATPPAGAIHGRVVDADTGDAVADVLVIAEGADSRATTDADGRFVLAEVPAEFYPPGGSSEESWRTLFYANLVSSFIGEILSDGASNEGNFDDGAWVQETINAVELSFRERRWVTLPLA